MERQEKAFIITIDTEEDNQWNNSKGCTTANAQYLPRFQTLCERYGFKPVYLTTYNMAKDDFFVDFAKDALKRNTCEIGMHLHAWCTPPEYKLMQIMDNRSYLIEYPEEIMEEKIKNLDELLSNTFERKIVTHRSGRWAINRKYIEILERYGYLCDCSVTPGVSWEGSLGVTGLKGIDYSEAPTHPYMISDSILEVPVTIQNLHYFDLGSVRSLKTLIRESYHLVKGKQLWIRPSVSTLYQMKLMLKNVASVDDYAMFMIHSSEMMPGGSPYYKDEYAVESLYEVLEALFETASHLYKGSTLEEYIRKS